MNRLSTPNYRKKYGQREASGQSTRYFEFYEGHFLHQLDQRPANEGQHCGNNDIRYDGANEIQQHQQQRNAKNVKYTADSGRHRFVCLPEKYKNREWHDRVCDQRQSQWIAGGCGKGTIFDPTG